MYVVRCKISYFVLFPCSADHKRNCPSAKRERVGPVAASSNNIESNKEAGGEHKVLKAQVIFEKVERGSPLCRV